MVNTCTWRLHVSQLPDGISWAIKSITGDHITCGRLEVNPMVRTEWLVRHLMYDLQANPDIPVHSLKKICQERFSLQVKHRLLYKVRSEAKEKIFGSFSEAYGLLPAYAEMIELTNPGSYALVTWTDQKTQTPIFKAGFFSFSAAVKGFLSRCRPIIGIDGSHLSSVYKGTLLTAVTIDGNNEILPFAYGIVSTESLESWAYFLKNLRDLFRLHGGQRDDWTFISDRMKGVESALYEVFPKATRRVCCQHLYKNCKDNGWSGSYFHHIFWIAIDAYNPYVFNKAMKKMTEHDPAAVAYLEKTTEQWSRHQFDLPVCCDHNITNFVESFNACTKPFRDLPVLSLLEAMRTWCMTKIGAKYDKAVGMTHDQLTDYAAKVLEERSVTSRFCSALNCGGVEFEVLDGHVKFPINLENRSCGCGKWQGSGIPCKHGLRVIYNERLEPINNITPWFKGDAYKATYSDHIHPLPDSTNWPSFDLPIIVTPYPYTTLFIIK